MSYARLKLKAPALTILLVSVNCSVWGQVEVHTYHNDRGAWTGQNVGETILSPSNVKNGSFGLLFKVGVDGKVDAEPLYKPGVTIPGRGAHNVVYAATEHDTVYAFDANSGAWNRILARFAVAFR